MLDGTTLPERLQRAAASMPDRVAVGVHDGDTLSYARWDRRSDALAGGLRRAGVVPGDRVAVWCDTARWTDLAVACLAVHKATAVSVPLSADLAALERRRILSDARPAALAAPRDLAPHEPGVATHCIEDLEEAGADQPLCEPAGADALAELTYTSHPLSRPAPQRRSHHRLAAGPWAGLDLGASAERLLHPFPPGAPPGQEAMYASLGPAPVAAVALETFRPDELAAALAATTAPACGLHPAAAGALVDSSVSAHWDLSAVAAVILSSGRVDGRLLARLGTMLPRAQLHLVDVLAGSHVTPLAFTHDRSRPGALGRPRPPATVWVADDAGQPAGAGEIGPLWVHLPHGEGGGAAATADLGYVREGGAVYRVTGKHDTVRRRGGPTLLRAELEEALRSHPTIAEAAVLGLPRDGAATKVVAAVVPRPSTSVPDARELRTVVADRLSADDAPDTVVLLDEIPRNSRGVLLWRQLRQRLSPASQADDHMAGEDPTADDAPIASGPASPHDEAEPALTRMWQRVLGVDTAEPHDDFFERGGGWYDAARLLNLVAAAFGVRVPLPAFLAAPTVAGLAGRLQERQPAAGAGFAEGTARSAHRWSAEVGELRRAPIAFSQQGMLWQERFAPGCQNLPGLARRFDGPLDLDALERALDDVVRRHEALRTTFEVSDGEPLQVVSPYRRRHLPLEDLTDLPPQQREARVADVVADAGARPRDLVSGPLFEATVLRLADDDHVLVLRTHHSVFDDWSVSVFRRELGALYAAHAEGRPCSLPELPVQPADFAADQQRRLAGSSGARELAFWRRELAGAPLSVQLPVDDPRRPPGSPQPPGEPVAVTLPPPVRTALQAIARDQRATLFMTVLAAFGVVVQRYTGQDDLVLATVTAHRNRTELEGVIGCFTKKVPLRLDLGDDPTFTEALKRARTALLGALGHQDLAFEDVVQDVLGPPAAAHGLVPQIAVMVQGVTPQQDLSMPGVDSSGYETSATTTRAHFMAGNDRAEDPIPSDDVTPSDDVGEPDGASATSRGEGAEPPWGDGLYTGTFVILSLNDSGEQLSLLARGAFHAPAVRDLLQRLRTLVDDVVAHPDRPVSELELLDTDGQAAAWALSRSEPCPARPTRLLDALRARVARRGDAMALSSAGRTMTYAELNERSTVLAQRLSAMGIRRGEQVAIALPVGADLIVAALAAWKAGAAWVPLEPDEPDDQREHHLTDTGVAALVATDTSTSLVPVLDPASVDDSTRDHPDPAHDQGASLQEIASGDVAVRWQDTAGQWVELEHDAAASVLAAWRGRLDEPEGIPGRAGLAAFDGPAGHDGFLRCLVGVLDGHRLHLPARLPPTAFDEIVDLVRSGAVDLLECTPAELEGLCGAGLATALGARGPRQVRVVVGSCEPVGADRWRAFGALPAQVSVAYRPPGCAFTSLLHPDISPGGRPDAGWPAPGVIAAVLDEHGRPVPDRACGQLAVGAQAPLTMTGQSARRLPDGRVELLDGHDVRGVRVAPSRIARGLATHPAVRDVSVLLEPDGARGHSIVARAHSRGRRPPLSELQAHLWSQQSGYAWPTTVHWLPADDGPSARDARFPHPPSASAEPQMLRRAWSDLLGVEHIADADNYWQDFSFLDALALARSVGAPLPDVAVTRNRAIAPLAATLAARHLPGQRQDS